MEVELYRAIAQHRKKGRKVSKSFIKITAKKNLMEKNHPLKESFKASNGWFHNFCKRKNIKFRKRKSGKGKSGVENLPEVLKFLAYLRHRVLPRREDQAVPPDYTPKWGRYPPERRYNMDQVPLPFVVSQDSTFTTSDDNDIHVKAPSDSLRKRQFTMHLFTDAGKGEARDGYTILVAKGKSDRRKKTEKMAWHKDVPMLFKKNAWVDKAVMRK